MFGKKVAEKKPFACVGCGCLIAVGREQRVVLRDGGLSLGDGLTSTYWDNRPDNIYCGRCKPPYDEILNGRFLRRVRVSEHCIEVTEEGKEIKPTTE